jgi:hypothetical protein
MITFLKGHVPTLFPTNTSTCLYLPMYAGIENPVPLSHLKEHEVPGFHSRPGHDYVWCIKILKKQKRKEKQKNNSIQPKIARA